MRFTLVPNSVYVSRPDEFLRYKLVDKFLPRRFQRPVHAQVGGHKIMLRRCDAASPPEVFLEEEYSCALPCVPKDSTAFVLDLGANIGAFSMYMLNERKHIKVHSVEAAADTFKVLTLNRSASEYKDRWSLECSAVSGEDGFAYFDIAGPSTHSRISTASRGYKVVSKTIQTLSKQLSGEIALVKIDVEGAEYDLMSRDISALGHIGNVVIELHRSLDDSRELLQRLRASHPFVYEVQGRLSNKPLIFATRARPVVGERLKALS